MVTRRRFLALGGKSVVGLAALAGAAAAGYEWPKGSAAATWSPRSPTQAPQGVQQFFSRPDLRPPPVAVVHRPGTLGRGRPAPQYVFLTPKYYEVTGAGQQGLMIVDAMGRLRWFRPTQDSVTNLQVQTYHGQPVLTWWEGDLGAGYGGGTAVISDTSYRQIAAIGKVGDYQPDLHELNLTPDGHVLLTAYQPQQTDLSSVGGAEDGYVLAGVALVVDVASGQLRSAWNSLDHVPLAESCLPFSGGTKDAPYDYFHINSVDLAPDGDLLISARNTWTIYKVSPATGEIVWRLNGKHSDFTMGPGANFFWQHHARAHDATTLTVFDNAASPGKEPESRGLVLRLDLARQRCVLQRAYTHPARLLAPNQGSMQLLRDGRVFIGWGAKPYFSEYDATGAIIMDGRFPTDVQSYRAFLADYVGRPSDRPVAAVGPSASGGSAVYVSWNGATEVAAWRVLAGRSSSDLQPMATADWAGFETTIEVDSAGPYFQVLALDKGGQEIGRSVPVTP